MNYLLTNHRLNRCKPVQVKSADFSKLTIKTIQVKFLDDSKTSRKFPFINPRYGLPTNAEVNQIKIAFCFCSAKGKLSDTKDRNP